MRNVTSDYPPTLLIHGTKDTDVPFEESLMMVKQFEKHGVSHLLKRIENGEHGFGGGDPQQITDAYETMRKFVVTHLSGNVLTERARGTRRGTQAKKADSHG